VGKGTRVAVQMTGRLPASATKDAPGGLQFFNTKNTDIQELGWRIGESGNIVPGLEEGMMGMRKGELRRIIVPGERAYNTEYIQSRKFEPQVGLWKPLLSTQINTAPPPPPSPPPSAPPPPPLSLLLLPPL